MRIGRTISGVAAGVAVAALLATVFPAQDALAKRKKRRNRGGAMRLIDVSVGSFAGVRHNAIVEFKFTSDVDTQTVSPAIFQIRGENDTRTGFTKQVPGSLPQILPREGRSGQSVMITGPQTGSLPSSRISTISVSTQQRPVSGSM